MSSRPRAWRGQWGTAERLPTGAGAGVAWVGEGNVLVITVILSRTVCADGPHCLARIGPAACHLHDPTPGT